MLFQDDRNDAHHQFNMRLNMARQTSENTFGQSVHMFGIFQKSMQTSLDLSKQVTLACCALFNFIKVVEKIDVEDPAYIEPTVTCVFFKQITYTFK